MSEENLGYGAGNNLGLSKVLTNYALIVNPDVTLEKDTIDNFFLTINDIKNFGIIAPISKDEIYTNFSIDNDKSIKEVESVKGFAMFLNMNNLKEIKFFDENFFLYFEEIDLCKRIRKKDIKIYIDPSIKVNHLGGTSHNTELNKTMELSRNWHWMWSSFYFYKKHHGYFYALFKMIGKFVSAIFKIILFTLTFNKNKRNIYYQRFSGILNSMMLRKSWYRPKIF